MKAAELITKAKTRIYINDYFFGYLIMELKFVEDKTCRTAWTDGFRVGYNPDFIESLPLSQVMGLIVHEVLHCVYDHCPRLHGRVPLRWNAAADYVINPVAIEAGYELPAGALIDEQYYEMTADHVYNILPNQKGGGGGDGPCPPGQPLDEVREPAQGQSGELSQKWTIATKQAANLARQQGTLKGSLERLVTEVLAPKIDWRIVLREFMTHPARDDYTMMRPNRRYISQNLYLPTLYNEGLGTAVITVDTSGSISDQEMAEFQAEINRILEDTQPEKIYIIYCDTDIDGEVKEYDASDLPLQLRTDCAGGGTDFTRPFEYVQDAGINPAVFVYFTDMYGGCRADTPDYPVLWLATTNHRNNPFGEVVEMS